MASQEMLQPSELGTREYWDTLYQRELKNNDDDCEDEGTIWFNESGAEDAIVRLLDQLNRQSFLDRASSRFLDLGTGNGHLLFTLAEAGDEAESWLGDLVGVDYSEPSVALARRLAEQKGLTTTTFEQWDILADAPGRWLQEGFDVVLDKGTFDAISLMRFDDGAPHPCHVYRQRVVPLIKRNKFLCITSCNWTKQELLDWLAPADQPLSVFREARYPTFTFGGQTGQSIVTLVLQRC